MRARARARARCQSREQKPEPEPSQSQQSMPEPSQEPSPSSPSRHYVQAMVDVPLLSLLQSLQPCRLVADENNLTTVSARMVESVCRRADTSEVVARRWSLPTSCGRCCH